MAAQQADSSGQITTVVLMSKTGCGKSSLGNALLKEKRFIEGDGFTSETKQCNVQMRIVHGRTLIVADTPGTMDSNDIKMPQGELLQTLNNCPNGVDAFLVVMRADSRFTDEEYRAIKETVDVFGPESCKRAIVVFSNGDRFKNDVDRFAQVLKKGCAELPGLSELMKQFGNRYVLMDNGENCDPKLQEKQVATLMSLIDVVSKANPNKYSKKDMDAQTDERKRREEAAQKQQETSLQEMAKLKAEIELLRMLQQQGPGLTDVLSAVGQGIGAVLVSPAVGAAKLIVGAVGLDRNP